MYFKMFKAQGLAHLSYMLGNQGSAIIVDPKRDISEYLEAAQSEGFKIKYILETHRQEDFVMGSAGLKEVTGAKIVGGSHEIFKHCDLNLKENESLEVGDFTLKVLDTPGHTPESVTYALYLKGRENCWGLFTGDALFIGDTGRTDLIDPDKTKENAFLLYDSINKKLRPLGEQTQLFPAHGSGSVCGGALASYDRSTLGFELGYNPVFTMNKDEFARHKLHERIPRPPYFDLMEKVNWEGGREISGAPSFISPLSPDDFKRKTKNNGLIIDTRLPEAFASGHIEGSYSIWLEGLAVFGGWILEEDTDVYLVMERERDLDKSFKFLSRLGVGKIKGFLAGGFEAWRDKGMPIESSGYMPVSELRDGLDDYLVYDVREINEYEDEGHIRGSRHCYVGHLEDCIDKANIPHDQKIVVTCAVGHRGGLGTSIFLRKGYKNVYNLAGGMNAWNQLKLETEGG